MFNNLQLFQKLFPEISCGFDNKVVTLRHGFLKQMIMKQVEERYISFEASKMAYRDIKNSVDTAKREGKQEGLAEGIEIGMEKGRAEGKHEANTETAQRLLAMGLSAEQVAKATQLSLEIIKNLSNS